MEVADPEKEVVAQGPRLHLPGALKGLHRLRHVPQGPGRGQKESPSKNEGHTCVVSWVAGDNLVDEAHEGEAIARHGRL